MLAQGSRKRLGHIAGDSLLPPSEKSAAKTTALAAGVAALLAIAILALSPLLIGLSG